MIALGEHFEAIGRGEVKEMYTAYEFAAELLHTDVPIKVIADHLTFETPLNFTKYFKKHRGMTPKAFRKTEKPRISPFPGTVSAVSLLKKHGK
jgi:AraC-like DNA-binding protein